MFGMTRAISLMAYQMLPESLLPDAAPAAPICYRELLDRRRKCCQESTSKNSNFFQRGKV
jgi:hypothetical protein